MAVSVDTARNTAKAIATLTGAGWRSFFSKARDILPVLRPRDLAMLPNKRLSKALAITP